MISDRGQGWQWKSIDILIAGSSSFCRALTSQLPEYGWSKAEESSDFCCALTGQLPEWLEQGSASFVGEGHCLWNRTLRRFLGSQTAFQVSLSREVTAFLTLVWWIQENETYNSNSSRGCQDDHVRVCPNWLKCWFFFVVVLIFNPYPISWLIGWTQLPKGMGVLSKVYCPI